MHISILTIIAGFESWYYSFLHHYWGSYTRKILIASLDLLNDLWPYLVSGIIITTLLKFYLSKNKVAAFFSRTSNGFIIFAALIGVVSPLGSYIIIPLAAALFVIGTPLPVLMSLLMSSPLVNPNLFLLTTGAFGLEMAFARTVSAFLLGIFAGYSTLWFTNKSYIKTENVLNKKNRQSIILTDSNNRLTVTSFMAELFKMTKYISKYFFLAIILAAVIKILTPPGLLIKLFRGNNLLSVLISTGAGVPFYVCGGAAIPVVEQLAELGMSKGAILAFFISGPVTKISNLVLMQSAFSTRIFVLYFFIGILGAVIMGSTFSILHF